MKKRITIAITLFLAMVNYIAAENKMSIMDFSISAGETKEVNVLLDNETLYVAFQFDLYLPTGISLAGYEVNSERVPASTEVSMAQQEDGSYRFLAAAMAMEPIVGNNGGIITLKLKASANVVTGNRPGSLRSVKLSKEDGSGQTAFEVSFTVKVLEPSIVTAKSYTREYGEENPTFEYDVKGGELEGVPEISCEATAASPVDTYPIVVKKGTVTNYNDSYVNGTLTITKAPLTITAQSYTIKQGEALPSFDVTYSGFKNSETQNVLAKKPKITCNATSWSDAGTYEITVSGAKADNYDFSYVKGTLTITEADPFNLTYMVDGNIYKTYQVKYGAAITPEANLTKEGYTFSGWSEIPAKMPGKDVTVTGSFTINKYKLTYKVDGETYKTMSIDYGTNITAEAEPVKEGYMFSGWSEIPTTMPAKDVIITGTFTKGQYKLVYKVDGQTYKTISFDYGAAITPEKAPEREGYTFSGWSAIPATMPAKDVTVTGGFTINKYKLTYIVDGKTYKTIEVEYGTSITAEVEPAKEGYTFSGWSLIPTTMPAKDVTVTGGFTINKYTLTYKVDGQIYKTTNVGYGTAIIPEGAPTEEGYTFSGWSEIPATMPAKDVTVIGSFTINKYKLTYKVDGETYRTYDVDYDSNITPEAEPSREGKTFSGWSEIPSTMPAKDVTVTGVFTINKYKLVYQVDDETYKLYEVEYGATITAETEPTKEGYTFSGWSGIPATMPAKDVTITGSFTKGEYQLTYVVDGQAYKTICMDYGNAITSEKAPEKEGYTFSGWSEIPTTMPAKDVTVTGTFTINKYALTYIVDGETYKTYEVEYGTAITPEAEPTKEGYTFSEWSEVPATMPAKDVTIMGSFTKGKYKLVYMVDGQTYKTISFDYGAAITPEKAPEREGYTFSGWSAIPATMPAKEVVVTGNFTINKYKLIYMVDDETYKTIEVEYGASIAPESEPVKEGYTFSGWSMIPTTMPARDVMVTGEFAVNQYTFTYMIDDQTYKTLKVEYGTKVVAEAEPTKEGYSFSGWSEFPTTMPAKDVIVTGSFTINKYTLTYKVGDETYKTYVIEYEANITAEEEPYQTGCTFSGWSEIPATMPARDVTITGSFAVNYYTLTYQVDGEIYKTYEIEYGANITAEEEPTKEGYTFSGWGEIPATMPPRNVTITGSFAVNNYTLTYQVGGETYKSYDIEYGANITAEAEPTKEGYTFSGWTEVPATMPAHDVTITGNFTFIDAIDDVITDDGTYQIFTLDGIPVESLQKGVNIIRYSNGTTKSVYVK